MYDRLWMNEDLNMIIVKSKQEELIYLILQFLDEEKFMLTRHKLEQETKMFFNLNHFGKLIIDGECIPRARMQNQTSAPQALKHQNQHAEPMKEVVQTGVKVGYERAVHLGEEENFDAIQVKREKVKEEVEKVMGDDEEESKRIRERARQYAEGSGDMFARIRYVWQK
ncbi:hypothetical protein K1719_030021 [Acacia pycnantha]|nr:hypothetical protein K1719_030021 [Acacia pycnantha]